MFLGLTIIALGNGLPDMILNVALAKDNFGEMAVTGSIAGPLFNLLVGFSIPLLIETWKADADFDLISKANISLLIAFGTILFNLVRLPVQAWFGE